MRVTAGPLSLHLLEVSVGYSKLDLNRVFWHCIWRCVTTSDVSLDNSIIPLTQRLASQCGISLWNHPGHIELYVSLQNCFAHNVVTLTVKVLS